MDAGWRGCKAGVFRDSGLLWVGGGAADDRDVGTTMVVTSPVLTVVVKVVDEVG